MGGGGQQPGIAAAGHSQGDLLAHGPAIIAHPKAVAVDLHGQAVDLAICGPGHRGTTLKLKRAVAVVIAPLQIVAVVREGDHLGVGSAQGICPGKDQTAAHLALDPLQIRAHGIADGGCVGHGRLIEGDQIIGIQLGLFIASFGETPLADQGCPPGGVEAHGRRWGGPARRRRLPQGDGQIIKAHAGGGGQQAGIGLGQGGKVGHLAQHHPIQTHSVTGRCHPHADQMGLAVSAVGHGDAALKLKDPARIIAPPLQIAALPRIADHGRVVAGVQVRRIKDQPRPHLSGQPLGRDLNIIRFGQGLAQEADQIVAAQFGLHIAPVRGLPCSGQGLPQALNLSGILKINRAAGLRKPSLGRRGGGWGQGCGWDRGRGQDSLWPWSQSAQFRRPLVIGLTVQPIFVAGRILDLVRLGDQDQLMVDGRVIVIKIDGKGDLLRGGDRGQLAAEGLHQIDGPTPGAHMGGLARHRVGPP